ncbi:MAG TPA: carbamoyl-phosphate synthase large subunit [Spirochaetota bacterium]|nr:carbamoyl-phosphate synthase large subunit [Spirochaetota bacterium]HOM39194.1 carbamoyl-phosphate synthase large subunit [Spirochaetota bacterium]HPQ49229.1 carbamoyl-phosphate synthase large subunit [Spirochaetota bacterium]
MPARKDINSILIIGAGPIIIGQACEFDYSGSQACKALKEEGYRVILANSNPATIMTDPNMADATYIEPLTVEFLEKIIAKEKPNAILPTLGGQTGLNLGMELARKGILEKYNVKMLGANPDVIEKAESREKFKEAMLKIGLDVPKSFYIKSVIEAKEKIKELGYPVIIRASFTLGGSGGNIAYNEEEMIEYVNKGINESPVGEVLLEESVLGWKEYELEVMRDKNDNVVIVCSIENFDPMGVHTGDSITVAPAQTLTNKEYQIMRDAAIKVIREIGVETGGSNIQFAINPENGRMVVIEMNPRVSRSSALASKATGFPIAKIATKLAIGYTLDEIRNDITKETPASFEPVLDYCVVKFPKWAFEKFKGSKPVLGVQMKSVGEVMAIGRTFKEAFNKAIRSLENYYGFIGKGEELSDSEILEKIAIPNPDRVFYIKTALDKGISIDTIYNLSKIDKWFLNQLKEIKDFEEKLKKSIKEYDYTLLYEAKQLGFSDKHIAKLSGTTEENVREIRENLGIKNVYKLVDTCAAEFEAKTPYYYSTYEEENEAKPSENKKVMIIGSGPNRIGQGIEFDYMCVQASIALKELGYESIMVNSNPETVSTDYDVSDKLYFEPLTAEDIINIYELEKPEGIILQLGGQTPLNISSDLEKHGLNILGTSSKAIEIAEDRNLFNNLVNKLGLRQPENGIAYSKEEAIEKAKKIGYPVLVRPSFVLGGRSMEIVYNEDELKYYMGKAIEASPDKPILIDRFLNDAIEIDVDCISDSENTIIAGIMQHIEEAGVHSGDSSCFLPQISVDKEIIEQIRDWTHKIAIELKIKGLMNIQYAVKDNTLYILEVNPRGSRTTPFVSKATIPWVKYAVRIMLGEKIKDMGLKEVIPDYYSVKEVVLPFNKFPEVDILLGPEMKSTGEVMGIDKDPAIAFAKAQISAGTPLPKNGSILITINDETKQKIVKKVKILKELGFRILTTSGTHDFFMKNGIESEVIKKIHEGRPNIIDLIRNREINLIFNTPTKNYINDDKQIRQEAIKYKIPVVTTVPAMIISIDAIKKMREKDFTIKSLQEWHKTLKK